MILNTGSMLSLVALIAVNWVSPAQSFDTAQASRAHPSRCRGPCDPGDGILLKGYNQPGSGKLCRQFSAKDITFEFKGEFQQQSALPHRFRFSAPSGDSAKFDIAVVANEEGLTAVTVYYTGKLAVYLGLPHVKSRSTGAQTWELATFGNAIAAEYTEEKLAYDVKSHALAGWANFYHINYRKQTNSPFVITAFDSADDFVSPVLRSFYVKLPRPLLAGQSASFKNEEMEFSVSCAGGALVNVVWSVMADAKAHSAIAANLKPISPDEPTLYHFALNAVL